MSTCNIYGLYDPRKPIELENCRYVGQTIQSLARHLNDHLASARNPKKHAGRDVWIRELLADGVRPEIHLIEEVDESQASDIECAWIGNGFAAGWELTNEGTGRMPIPWDSSPYLTPEYLERFWSNIINNGEDECWGWKLYKTDKGYGQFTVGAKRDKNIRRILIHRLMWEIVNGPIPNRLLVCHRCDNPECANPKHLFLDTSRGNMSDAAAKGRIRNQFSGLPRPTHCPRGHEYLTASDGQLYCLECNRDNTRRYRDKQREEAGLPPARKYGELTHCINGHEFTEENTYVIDGHKWCLICKRESNRKAAQRIRDKNRPTPEQAAEARAKHSAATAAFNTATKKGVPLSEEHKAKVSASGKIAAANMSPEAKERQLVASRTKPSEETRQKMSEAQKAVWARRRAEALPE